jgi:hypothetical protein
MCRVAAAMVEKQNADIFESFANALPFRVLLQVRGFGDQQLRTAAKPEDRSNRRISVIVQYREPTAGEAAAEVKDAHAGEASGE